MHESALLRGAAAFFGSHADRGAVPAPLRTASTTLESMPAVYPEGPLWQDGKLLFVEYAGPGIKMWDGKRTSVYWRGEHCGASGLIAYRRDHLLVACYDANTIVELDKPASKSAPSTRTAPASHSLDPMISPRMAAAESMSSASGVYDVKAPISGSILHLSGANGTLVEVANLIHYSNGLTLSKDGKSLLVAEMLAGRILVIRGQCRRHAGIAHCVGAPAGSCAAHRSRGCLQWSRRPQARAGRQLLHRAQRLGPRAGGECGQEIGAHHQGRDALRDQHEFRRRRAPATLYITGVFDPNKAPFPGAVYRWRNDDAAAYLYL